MRIATDIDVDVRDRNEVLKHFHHIPASMYKNDLLVKHNSGIYFQEIPLDPISKNSAIDYEEAENRGWFKVDLLNVSIYDEIKDEEHLDRLLNIEPYWELLEHKDFIIKEKIWQISNERSAKIVSKMKPKSIEEMAMILGIIRPAKMHLFEKSWNYIRKNIWIPPQKTDKHYKTFFKKPHAIAYATIISIQLNLIVEQAYGID